MFAAIAASLIVASSFAQGFKFSNQDTDAQAREQAKNQAIADQISTPCREQLRNKKIMLVIGEQASGGGISANQQNYGPHFDAINRRLRLLGLRTTTPEEIRKQIAQAELDAYFKGDPDAALAASRKFGASFILRGLIESRTSVNPVIRVNEVNVSMSFALTDSAGHPISDATAQGGSYAGGDVRGVAAKLINEQADEVVARLYSDYCNNAGTGGPARKK
jgi:hypothetical protein